MYTSLAGRNPEQERQDCGIGTTEEPGREIDWALCAQGKLTETAMIFQTIREASAKVEVGVKTKREMRFN